MAEQSSTVVAVRGLVMLVCLVLVPVAAFCGGSFPAVVKAIQSGRWPTLADFRHSAEPPPSAATVAPRFVPPAAKTVPQPVGPQALGFPGRADNLGVAAQIEAPHSQVVAANYTAPADSTPPPMTLSPPAGFSQDKQRSVGFGQPPDVLPGTAEKPLAISSSAAGSGEKLASGERISGTAPDDQFKLVQQRLRQLGATYYILETFGDETREFRFYCRMSVGGNPHVSKPFWCTDGNALKAMTGVLKQVEEWRSGGG